MGTSESKTCCMCVNNRQALAGSRLDPEEVDARSLSDAGDGIPRFPALASRLNTSDETTLQALRKAVVDGSAVEFRKLVEALENQEHRQRLLEATDGAGETLMHEAVRADRPEIVEALNDLAPNSLRLHKHSGDYDKKMPVHIAIEMDSPSKGLLRAIVGKKPAVLEFKNGLGQACLHMAAAKGNVEVIEELFRLSPRKEILLVQKDANGRTPLHLAVKHNNIQAVLAIIKLAPEKHGVLEQHDSFGRTPLIEATHYGALAACNEQERQITLELLRARATADAQYTTDGATLLTCAAQSGQEEIVVEILKARGDPAHATRHGETALINASREGHKTIAVELINARAVITHKDREGWSALMYSSGRGHLEIVQKLIESDANPQNNGEHGNTALICAAKSGMVDVIDALLKARADVKWRNLNGNTALILACTSGHMEAVSKLLAAKADPTRKDNSGITAIEVASYKGFSEIADLLQGRKPVKVAAVEDKGAEQAAVK